MDRQPGHNVAPQLLAGSGQLLILLKAVILALAISVVLLFIGALVLYLTAVPETITPYFVFGTSFVAIIAGSSFAGKRIGFRGWIYGGIVGTGYVLLMLVAGLFILDDVSLGWNFITKLFLGFIFGAAGGMWGVNR